VWRFRPPSEGTLEFRCRLEGRPVGSDGLVTFLVFRRIDVRLELHDHGEWTVEEAPGAPWSWVPDR